MSTPRSVLQLCQELHTLGFSRAFEPGDRVGRGFADFGYEEFSLINGQQVVSLITGQRSSIKEDEKQHFFLVPSPDQLVIFIFEAGWDIQEISYHEQRSWRCSLIKGKNQFRSEASTLQETLLKLFVSVYGSKG